MDGWRTATINRYALFVDIPHLPPQASLRRQRPLEQGQESRWLLTIPGGVSLDTSLHIHVRHEDVLSIEVGEGATVTFVVAPRESIEGMGVHHVDLRLEPHAEVTYLSLQTLPRNVQYTLRERAVIGQEASIRWHVVTLGGGNVDHALHSVIEGEGGRSDVSWMFFGSEDERQVLSVQNTFNAPRGGGEIMMKGIAQDRSHVAARGMIEIGPSGGGTTTYLTQSVLMLDATAKVDAVPGLAIKTNDVKASHSASVARVSPEDLFYFATRGIPVPTARRLYIEGFLGELVDRMPDPDVLALVRNAIAEKYAL